MPTPEYRYIDNLEPISQEQLAGMTRQGLVDTIGAPATDAMSEEELESHVDDAINARLDHGLIELMPDDL